MKIAIEKQDERIETFLKGKMSAEEAKEFKAELQQDKELRRRAQTMALLIKAMREVGARRDAAIIEEITKANDATDATDGNELGKTIMGCEAPSEAPINAIGNDGNGGNSRNGENSRNNENADSTAKRKRSSVKLIASIAAVAACLCIMLGIADYQLEKRDIVAIAMNHPKAFLELSVDGEAVDRGAVETKLDSILAGISADKSSAELIIQLEAMYAQASSDTFNDYTNYHQEIGYWLAIAYLQANKREAAEQLLVALIQEYPGSPLFASLLEKVRAVKGLF